MQEDEPREDWSAPPCVSCGERALFILNEYLLCGDCLLTEPWVSDLFTLVGEAK